MWNENHGEINEKVWVNQKNKKIKTKLGFVIRTWPELRNTTPPRERKSHKTEIMPNQSYAIVPNRWSSSSMRSPWSLSSMGSPCTLWDFSVSGFQRKSDKSCVFVGYVWVMFLNFVGLFQGMKILLWAFFKGWKFCNFFIKGCGLKKLTRFFFHTYFKGVLIYFEGLKNFWNKVK